MNSKKMIDGSPSSQGLFSSATNELNYGDLVSLAKAELNSEPVIGKINGTKLVDKYNSWRDDSSQIDIIDYCVDYVEYHPDSDYPKNKLGYCTYGMDSDWKGFFRSQMEARNIISTMDNTMLLDTKLADVLLSNVEIVKQEGKIVYVNAKLLTNDVSSPNSFGALAVSSTDRYEAFGQSNGNSAFPDILIPSASLWDILLMVDVSEAYHDLFDFGQIIRVNISPDNDFSRTIAIPDITIGQLLNLFTDHYSQESWDYLLTMSHHDLRENELDAFKKKFFDSFEIRAYFTMIKFVQSLFSLKYAYYWEFPSLDLWVPSADDSFITMFVVGDELVKVEYGLFKVKTVRFSKIEVLRPDFYWDKGYKRNITYVPFMGDAIPGDEFAKEHLISFKNTDVVLRAFSYSLRARAREDLDKVVVRSIDAIDENSSFRHNPEFIYSTDVYPIAPLMTKRSTSNELELSHRDGWIDNYVIDPKAYLDLIAQNEKVAKVQVHEMSASNVVGRNRFIQKQIRNSIKSKDYWFMDFCYKEYKDKFSFSVSLPGFDSFLEWDLSLKDIFLFKGWDWEKFEGVILKVGDINLFSFLQSSLSELIAMSSSDWSLLFDSLRGKISTEVFNFISDLYVWLSGVWLGGYDAIVDFLSGIDDMMVDLKKLFSGGKLPSISDISSLVPQWFSQFNEFISGVLKFFSSFGPEDDGFDFVLKKSVLRMLKPFYPKYPDDIFLSVRTYLEELSMAVYSSFITDKDKFSPVSRSTSTNSNYIDSLIGKIDDLGNSLDFNIDIQSVTNNIANFVLSALSGVVNSVAATVSIIENILNLFSLASIPVSVSKPKILVDAKLDGEEKFLALSLPRNVGIKADNLVDLSIKDAFIYEDSLGKKSNFFLLNIHGDYDNLFSRYEEGRELKFGYQQLAKLLTNNGSITYKPSGSEIAISQGIVAAQAALAAGVAAISTSGGPIAKSIAAGAAFLAVETINQISFAQYMIQAGKNPHTDIFNSGSSISSTADMTTFYLHPSLVTVRERSAASTFVNMAQEVAAISGGFMAAGILGLAIGAIATATKNFSRKRAIRKQFRDTGYISFGGSDLPTDKLSRSELNQYAKFYASQGKRAFLGLPQIAAMSLVAKDALVNTLEASVKLATSTGKHIFSGVGNAPVVGSSIAEIAILKASIDSQKSLLELINRKLGY